MNLDDATGASSERTIVLDGEEFRVGVMSMKGLGRIQHFLRSHPAPDPLAEIREILPGLDTQIQRDLVANALGERKGWPPDPHTNPGLAFSALCELEGGAEHLLRTILLDCKERGRCRADITEAEIARCASAADADGFNEAAMAAARLGGALRVRRASAEAAILDRHGCRSFALLLLDALGLDAEPERVAAAADAVPLELCGTRILLEVAEDEAPAVPKATAGDARKAARSPRSTSSKPTPS